MTELPAQFMSAEPDNTAPDSVKDDPKLLQSRLRVQTIRRFQALNQEIARISDPQEWEAAWTKLDALATREYGKAWEVLRQPEVEVVPLVIGGKTKDELRQALVANGYIISNSAEGMLDSPGFVTQSHPEPVELILLTTENLGLHDPEIEEIYHCAKQFGLDLCPPDAGPQYRLQTPNQPLRERVNVGMQPIANPIGEPYVFRIQDIVSRRWLDGLFAGTRIMSPSNQKFLFRLPAAQSKPAKANHV